MPKLSDISSGEHDNLSDTDGHNIPKHILSNISSGEHDNMYDMDVHNIPKYTSQRHERKTFDDNWHAPRHYGNCMQREESAHSWIRGVEASPPKIDGKHVYFQQQVIGHQQQIGHNMNAGEPKMQRARETRALNIATQQLDVTNAGNRHHTHVYYVVPYLVHDLDGGKGDMSPQNIAQAQYVKYRPEGLPAQAGKHTQTQMIAGKRKSPTCCEHVVRGACCEHVAYPKGIPSTQESTGAKNDALKDDISSFNIAQAQHEQYQRNGPPAPQAGTIRNYQLVAVRSTGLTGCKRVADGVCCDHIAYPADTAASEAATGATKDKLVPEGTELNRDTTGNKSLAETYQNRVTHTIGSYGNAKQQEEYGQYSNAGRIAPKALMILMGLALASAHTAEESYGRQPQLEVVKIKGLSPPGLTHASLPSYLSNNYSKGIRTEPEHHTITNHVQEDKTLKGLRIATINVTSWSPKIRKMITNMSGEFDIILIQEHHKLRRKDMNTGPYVLAAFAPAQKTIPTQDGRGWHNSGGG